jgi:hypothetical protein
MARDTGAKPKKRRFAQLRQTYTMAKRSDPRIGLITLGVVLLVLAVIVGIAVLLDSVWWIWLIVGLPTALLAGAIVFGRRAERAAYAQLQGQPGAAASALGTLRKQWIVTQAVAVNKQGDMVHRVLGRPGIVLVGEGTSSGRVNQLLTQERKRHTRVAYEVPVTEVVVGDGDGQVPLRRLSKHVMKLDRKLRPSEVTEVNNRLRALQVQPVPIPKGPLPRNLKLPKGGLQGR